MRSNHRLMNALLAVVLGTMLPGCLSLGGKTVYSSETPQTSERLSALENRVSVLERAVAGNAGPPNMPVPMGRPPQ